MRSPLRPGRTLGILGGGPAGRAIAVAARNLGFRIHALDSDPTCPIEPWADRVVAAPLDDASAAAEALAGCDVVTTAIEDVPPHTLAAVARTGAAVRPSLTLLAIAQHRILEREWLDARGIATAPWGRAASLDDARALFARFGGRCVLKPAQRAGAATGARIVESLAGLDSAWYAIGGWQCVVEQALEIDTELSVVVARSPSGAVATYPMAESRRQVRDGVPRLHWTLIPATGHDALAAKARRLATLVAERFKVEGLLSVEMFLLTDGRLVVNELVPGPHATYAASELACATGQYEQLVRAVCDLPLGPVAPARPTAMAPIHGDEWTAADREDVAAALRRPGITLQAYGVASPAAERRVAHFAASADTPEEAVAAVICAHAALGTGPRDGPASSRRAWRAGVAAASALLLTACATVHQDQVGVKRTFGKVSDKTIAPGAALFTPGVQQVVTVPSRTVNREVRLELPSKEGLNVAAEVSILYRIRPDMAPAILRTSGEAYEDVVILPVFRSAAADVTARFFAKDMYSGERTAIEKGIQQTMAASLESRGFLVEQVLLKSIRLPAGLAQAVEDKLAAEQRAEQMRFILERERQEAERKRIEAEGLRSAQDIIAASLSPLLIEYESIRAFRELAASQNAKLVVTDGRTPFFLGPGEAAERPAPEQVGPVRPTAGAASREATTRPVQRVVGPR